MTDLTNSGLPHQEKIVESIALLKEKVRSLRSLLEKFESADAEQSIQIILSEIQHLETESSYFFELTNCKHLMMVDQVTYIKKLELELQGLKLQK